jgi:maleylpyruvate isomerase
MDDKTAAVVAALADATNRLVRTVDAMTDEQYAEPSLLPGWTRAHVVAHLALNAEGLGGAVHGITSGVPTPMYLSNEARDSDIEQVSALPPTRLRERLLASSGLFADAIGHLTDEGWSEKIERVPGGMQISVSSIPARRRTEVEIHHADLGLAYSCDDWPGDFCAALIPVMAARLQDRETGFTVVATDLNRTWDVAGGGPEVSGTGADLGWWLSGRGGEERLGGDVPEIGEW